VVRVSVTTTDAGSRADDDGGGDGDHETDEVTATEPTDAEPTPAPPRLSVGLAVGLGGFAAALLAAGSLLSGAVALLGVALLGASLSVVSVRLCSAAGVTFVLAFVAAAATGAVAAPLVGGAILAVAAWDVADHGIGLAGHVGREAPTRRNELVHAAASLAVGSAAGAVAFGVYLAAGAGQPSTALVFLLFGGVLLLVALRD
jgi:hypothetical protein